MKKHLMSFLTLILFVVLIGSTTTTVRAEDAGCGDGKKKLVFHWHRYDGEYNNAGLHLWGTNGTSGATPIAGVDGFGAYFNICIGENPSTDQRGANTIGFIPLELKEDGSANWDTKASFNGDDLFIDVSYLFTEITPDEGEPYTPDEMHVFFVDNGEEVFHLDNYNPELNYIFVLYADQDNRYEGWGIHTWGTGKGGDSPVWGNPLPLGGTNYTTSENKFPMKLAAIGVGDDATKVGFIMTNGVDKAYPDDIFIEGELLDPIKEEGQDFTLLYYLSGKDGFSTKEEFFKEANTYRIEFKFVPFDNEASVGDAKGTYAQSPNLIQVVFNQEIRVRVSEDNELKDYEGFSTDFFKLTEDGKEIDIIVSYLEDVEFVKNFVITFEDENFKLDHTKSYKLFYDNGKEDFMEQQKAEIEVDLDKEAPTIELVGVTNNVIEIPFGAKLGEGKFIFPDYFASDNRDGDITDRVFVPDGKGTVNTNKAGDYKVALAVSDNWGHYTELEFTFRVLEPESKGLGTGAWVGIIAGVVVLVGAVAGAAIFMSKKKSL